MKCYRCGTDHDLPSKEWPLSGFICSWRAERPDEWTMDDFLRKSLALEKRCEEAERERGELAQKLKEEMMWGDRQYGEALKNGMSHIKVVIKT